MFSVRHRAKQPEVDESGSFHKSIWLQQYTKGMQHEVYRVRLSSSFENSTFAQAAESVYHKLGIMMFAVQRKANRKNENGAIRSNRTMLFPGNEVCITAL